ncbi:MAG: PAS domain S-box protein [Nitrospirota bacterium]|nr:PAS domain S-box protein [Nitrospirota bacterium]
MSLRIKALLPLFLFSLILFAYLYAYWSPRVVANIETNYRKATERHLDSVVEGLIPLLLARQLDAIYENLDSLREKNRDWAGIELVNAEGKTIYPLNPLPRTPVEQKGDIRALEQNISYLDTNLGKMIVRVDFAPVITQIKKKNREMLITLLSILAGFILLIGLTLERVVSRPARQLAHASEMLAKGNFDTGLPKARSDEIGTLVGSFASMRDEIRGYQAELLRRHESLVKLSHAVEQSPVSIVITDAKGDIEFVNPKFTQITGYTFEEVLGKNPRILKSGETSPEEYKRLWESITSGRIWHGYFHNRKKSGELFWESASISPIQNEDGTITHFVAIKEDITEQKKLEEQLRQSQKMEAVGQLAGGIAHDFNNMLTAILGYGSLLSGRLDEDSPLRHYADQILAVGEKTANLTRQLLAFSRKQIIRPRPVDPNEIIRGIEKFSQRLLGEDIEVKTRLDERELTVMVDPGQMEQVLVNLFTNARDAMPDGGVLSISTGIVELDEEYAHQYGMSNPGRYVLLTVSDTGSGMDEKTREKIFEPFFTTKAFGKGTGLGLSIVYGIIKQHGGHINVYSEAGKGSSFKIYLPLISRTQEEEEQYAVSAVPSGGKETILIAEDNEEVRGFTRHVLEGSGYTVIETVDGEDAVAKFEDNKDRVNLLLLDVIMPKKSGKEVSDIAKRIRPDIKILFTSGYTADIIHKKGIFDKGLDFISKPASPKELLGKIRETLDR